MQMHLFQHLPVLRCERVERERMIISPDGQAVEVTLVYAGEHSIRGKLILIVAVIPVDFFVEPSSELLVSELAFEHETFSEQIAYRLLVVRRHVNDVIE